jgi:hypothetical protein
VKLLECVTNNLNGIAVGEFYRERCIVGGRVGFVAMNQGFVEVENDSLLAFLEKKYYI